MIVETTLNLNAADVLLLNSAADETGYYRSRIIIMLLKKAMKELKVMVNKNGRIQYQERSEDNDWQPIHATMLLRDYEYFLDMKKLCKLSFAAIIAASIKKFLNKIIEECKSNNSLSPTDNYQFIHYILAKKIIDGVIIWTMYWGLPEKILTQELQL